MRLFIAINLSDAMKNALESAQDQMYTMVSGAILRHGKICILLLRLSENTRIRTGLWTPLQQCPFQAFPFP